MFIDELVHNLDGFHSCFTLYLVRLQCDGEFTFTASYVDMRWIVVESVDVNQ